MLAFGSARGSFLLAGPEPPLRNGGSIDVVMDFANPVIKGMSLFHCHLLNHKEKGMMAKILFE